MDEVLKFVKHLQEYKPCNRVTKDVADKKVKGLRLFPRHIHM